MKIKCIANGETASVFPSKDEITGYYGGLLVVTWDFKILLFIDTNDPEDVLYEDVTNEFELLK